MVRGSIKFLFFLMGCLTLGCTPEKSIQGYIEARFTYIAANFNGILTHLWVERGTQIKVGAPLFTLDQQPQTSDFKEAQAAVNEAIAEETRAKAELENTKIRYERRKTLLQNNAIAVESVDDAKTAYLEAQATLEKAKHGVKEAQARLEQAHWSKNQKTVYADQNAFVYDTYARQSEIVTAEKQVVSLLAPADIKIIFYLPEPQLSLILVGDQFNINCDSYAKAITAKITFISPQAEYTPPVLYGQEYRAKLLYRVEARPNSLSNMHCLHPGQPVNIWLRKDNVDDKK